MKSFRFIIRIFPVILAGILLLSPARVRTPLQFPDILGYRTLKCDFHMHTVFSDGNVWPTVRAEEAWRNGLDAIAITDHIEYQPHKADVNPDHNRSFDIARPDGEKLGITMIKGSEITRKMPPGHLNAIFIRDASLLAKDTWREALAEAVKQDAFIFWNHPGWKGQQPDGVARWYPEHTELFEQGNLHGIEVVNEREYYPEAHRWSIEYNLTMLSNSDVHDPVFMDYDPDHGDHRAYTLVFATDNSVEAIREALFDRRTVVVLNNLMAGAEPWLQAIFKNSVQVKNSTLIISAGESVYLQVHNTTAVDYALVRADTIDGFEFPHEVILYGGKTVLIKIKRIAKEIPEQLQISLPFRVSNLKVTPDESLFVEFPLTIIPASE